MARHRAGRKKASQRQQSLNQLTVEEFTAASIDRPRPADFSDLFGRWTPDPEFDDIVASQRRIDLDKWERESH